MSQNIFDDNEFFEQYLVTRNNPESYNNLIEQPLMKSLLPDLKSKTVLDMGCGFGSNCMDFIEKGASKVVGIDISENMIKLAMNQNMNKNIQYIRMNMEQIDSLKIKFDFIYSSLAIHYIADFVSLIKKIYDLLNNNGVLLFSQEHPLCTAPMEGPSWNKDEEGIKISSPVSNYLTEGERKQKWLGKNPRQYYHRSFSSLINTLVKNEFSLLEIIEPSPTTEVLNIAPDMYDEVHRPTAIVIKAQKIEK
jgi:2-polyprenyl-3-methyl-5-hydroxy-6-metoxy-1,4-benzoquinol methylase